MRPILGIDPTMFIEQFYLGCLAHASYFIADSGEAAVVDPQRDVDEYIAEAAATGCGSATSSRRTSTPIS